MSSGDAGGAAGAGREGAHGSGQVSTEQSGQDGADQDGADPAAEQGATGLPEHLPPRPDASGEPAPPPAAAFIGSDGAPEDDPARERRLSHKPKPPNGRGPVLAWHRENTRSKIIDAVGSFSLLAALITFTGLFDDHHPLAWMGMWPIWLLILAGAYLITSPFTFAVVSVGADWLMMKQVRWGVRINRRWVRLYELTRVQVLGGPGGAYLSLSDAHTTVGGSFPEFQHDRAMWDLIYNGILHSVVGGAEVNRAAWNALYIDESFKLLELKHRYASEEIDTTTLSDERIRRVMRVPDIVQFMELVDFPADSSPEEFRELIPKLYSWHLPPETDEPADGPAEVSEGLPATVDTATLTDEQVRRLMAEPGMQEVMSAEDFPAEASPWAFRQMFPTIDRQYLPEPATTHRSQREEPQA